MHDVRDLGIREVVRRTVEAVRDGRVFMTVDVDGSTRPSSPAPARRSWTA